MADNSGTGSSNAGASASGSGDAINESNKELLLVSNLVAAAYKTTSASGATAGSNGNLNSSAISAPSCDLNESNVGVVKTLGESVDTTKLEHDASLLGGVSGQESGYSKIKSTSNFTSIPGGAGNGGYFVGYHSSGQPIEAYSNHSLNVNDAEGRRIYRLI